MFSVINHSNNELVLDGGHRLAVSGTYEIAEVSEQLRSLESKGWVSIIEMPEAKTPAADPPKGQDPTKKGDK